MLAVNWSTLLPLLPKIQSSPFSRGREMMIQRILTSSPIGFLWCIIGPIDNNKLLAPSFASSKGKGSKSNCDKWGLEQDSLSFELFKLWIELRSSWSVQIVARIPRGIIVVIAPPILQHCTFNEWNGKHRTAVEVSWQTSNSFATVVNMFL